MTKASYQTQLDADLTQKAPAVRFKGFDEPWERKRLGEISAVYSGGTPSVGKNEYYKDGTIPFIRSGEISEDHTELFITEDGLKNSSAAMVDRGNILYALYGATSGEVSRAKLKGAINQAILAIIPNMGYDSEYLMQWLRMNKKNIIDTYLQGGQGNLSGAIVKKLLIGYPSEIEQSRIGAFFQCLDTLITIYQRKTDKLTEIKKAMLGKMLPREGRDVPEIRFKGFSEPWERKRLGEIGTAYSGLSGKTKSDFGHGDGHFVPYMNVFLNPIAEKQRLEAIEKDETQNQVKYGDVFFTTSSETPEEVGMSSVWLDNTPNVYLNSFCFGYRPTETINPYYLAYMLRSESVRRKIVFLAQGISRYNISKNRVMEIAIQIPSIEEQSQIGAFFQRLDTLITLYQHKHDKLRDIKAAMLGKMFV